MSLITTYLKLTKEYSDKYGEKTVVLMMVGSFYEIYGEKHSNSNSDGSNIVKRFIFLPRNLGWFLLHHAGSGTELGEPN